MSDIMGGDARISVIRVPQGYVEVEKCQVARPAALCVTRAEMRAGEEAE